MSIVIVSWNVRKLLRQCLQSLFKDNEDSFSKAIVIDNASEDKSALLVRQEFPLAVLLENTVNRGFAFANNQGIELADTDLILFLNPDTMVLPSTLNSCKEFLVQHPEIGILGCKVLNPDGSIQYSCRAFPSISNYLWESFFLHKLMPRLSITGKFYGSSVDYSREQEVDVVLGAFMLVRREVLQQVGQFDERFFIYSEETDLCYRAKKAGWKVVYYPEASIIHFGGSSTNQNSIKMFLEDHKSRLFYMLKHFSLLKTVICEFLIIWGVLFRVILWSLLSIWDLVRKTPRRVSAFQKLKIFSNLLLWYLTFQNLKVALGKRRT